MTGLGLTFIFQESHAKRCTSTRVKQYRINLVDARIIRGSSLESRRRETSASGASSRVPCKSCYLVGSSAGPRHRKQRVEPKGAKIARTCCHCVAAAHLGRDHRALDIEFRVGPGPLRQSSVRAGSRESKGSSRVELMSEGRKGFRGWAPEPSPL